MKKQIKKLLVVVMTMAMVLSMMPSIQATAASKGKVKSVKVTNVKNKKVTLTVGQSKKLKVKVSIKGKVSKKVTYKSSNKKVATVTKKGIVKAKKAGKANITVRSKANKKKKVVIKVKVKKKSTATKPATPATQPTTPATTKPVETTTVAEVPTTPSEVETTTPASENEMKPTVSIKDTIGLDADNVSVEEGDEYNQVKISYQIDIEEAGLYSISFNEEIRELDPKWIIYSEEYGFYTEDYSFEIEEPGTYNLEITLCVTTVDEIDGLPFEFNLYKSAKINLDVNPYDGTLYEDYYDYWIEGWYTSDDKWITYGYYEDVLVLPKGTYDSIYMRVFVYDEHYNPVGYFLYTIENLVVDKDEVDATVSSVFKSLIEGYDQTEKTIELDKPLDVVLGKNYEFDFYKFTAPEDGTYYIYTDSPKDEEGEDECDTYGVVVLNDVPEYSDDEYGYDFGFEVTLNKGETCYIGVKPYFAEDEGETVKLCVSLEQPEEEVEVEL